MKTVKSSRATKDARRARRKGKAHRRHEDRVHLTPLGTMEPALQRRILAAFDGFDPSAPWADMAQLVLPVIKRVVQPFPPSLAPMTIVVPPGIPTGFGLDVGPAFSHVTPAMLEAWGVDSATVLTTALDNLRELVGREPPRIDPLAIDGTALLAVQGQGWGSALVLVPDVLGRILGPEPRLLITPVRNTLVAMPETVDPELVVHLWSAIADGRHDELEIEPLRWTGTDIAALDGRGGGLVH